MVIIAVIATIRAVTHTAFEIKERSRRFVRRKRPFTRRRMTFVTESIGDCSSRYYRNIACEP